MNEANKILDAIYNTAEEISKSKFQLSRDTYKVLRNGKEKIIKFNEKLGNYEFYISNSDYEKIKKEVEENKETDKYEPKNMGQWMRKFEIEYRVNSLKDKVKLDDKVGWISGFTNNWVYVKDAEENYLQQSPTYKQMDSNKLKLIYRNNNWIYNTYE